MLNIHSSCSYSTSSLGQNQACFSNALSSLLGLWKNHNHSPLQLHHYQSSLSCHNLQNIRQAVFAPISVSLSCSQASLLISPQLSTLPVSSPQRIWVISWPPPLLPGSLDTINMARVQMLSLGQIKLGFELYSYLCICTYCTQ